jgi:hypothetical protein
MFYCLALIRAFLIISGISIYGTTVTVPRSTYVVRKWKKVTFASDKYVLIKYILLYLLYIYP